VNGSACLIESIRGLLQRTYLIQSGLSEIGPFVIGDEGYLRLYGSPHARREVPSPRIVGAKTLVRETREGVAACIYFPDGLIHKLEAFPPQRGLVEENVEAFATFVEEIDHLLVIAERSRLGRPVSLFELELHADVSKYLVLARFLAGRADRLRPAEKIWLRRRLFEAERYCNEDPRARERYRDAARWAVRLIVAADSLAPGERIDTLRSFHTAGAAGKVELIVRLAR
jgi:hypothetical protein